MRLYRISDDAVLAEMDNGTKYEIPWELNKAITLKGDTALEKFVQLAGHLVFDSTEIKNGN